MRFILTLMWLLHWLPLSILARIGEAAGFVLFYCLKKRRRITLINLALCLPQRAEAERYVLARQHFQAYARSILERGILWWASEKRLRCLLEIESAFPLSALAGSQATILLCPHFVNLDVAGTALSLDIFGCSIYTQQQNAVFDRVLRKGRARFKPAKLFPRSAGILPIMKAMRQGLPFLMLPDMDFGIKNAVFVPFFGQPAATLTAPARLAATLEARVIPVVATFLPRYQGWKVRLYPAWKDYPGSDVVLATQRMNEFIEARILENPAEYLWTHKRFKTRPAGEKPVY